MKGHKRKGGNATGRKKRKGGSERKETYEGREREKVPTGTSIPNNVV